jgi:light-regulated signal transduction histidine kinase (bacteriophytochrome)
LAANGKLKRGAQVQLSASLSPASKVIITVEDNGIGIVEEALERIFMPFFATNKRDQASASAFPAKFSGCTTLQSAPNQSKMRTAFTLKFD